MDILFQDDHFFAINKPAGYFIHPPERSPYPVPRERICLYHLRERMKREVFPVHRLDAPTSGVVLFAMSRGDARELNRLFAERLVHKTYHAVVRGFVAEEGRIDIPLEIAGFDKAMESETLYKRLAVTEFPVAVGTKYPTARYSLVQVHPVSGRWHQIRRHFDRVAHPLLGDIEHGDSHHNRFFRDDLKIPGLCLKAAQISLQHPWSGDQITITAPECEKWRGIYKLFGLAD
jgi:tRNA pseudouridine65 synthase